MRYWTGDDSYKTGGPTDLPFEVLFREIKTLGIDYCFMVIKED
jgi:hypothetical protein